MSERQVEGSARCCSTVFSLSHKHTKRGTRSRFQCQAGVEWRRDVPDERRTQVLEECARMVAASAHASHSLALTCEAQATLLANRSQETGDCARVPPYSTQVFASRKDERRKANGFSPSLTGTDRLPRWSITQARTLACLRSRSRAAFREDHEAVNQGEAEAIEGKSYGCLSMSRSSHPQQ